MATERIIRGKHDDGKHDGLYANRKRLEAALFDQETFEQIRVSMMVYRQRSGLPKELVDYHAGILKESGFLDKNDEIPQN